MDKNHGSVGDLFQVDDDAFRVVSGKGLQFGTVQCKDMIGYGLHSFRLEIAVVYGKVVVD